MESVKAVRGISAVYAGMYFGKDSFQAWSEKNDGVVDGQVIIMTNWHLRNG